MDKVELSGSLYTPGWFYQQLLKLGAAEGIDDLSEWYVVWDSDLLPIDAWPLIREHQQMKQYTFALLQHNQWGNAQIVSTWEKWIRSVGIIQAPAMPLLSVGRVLATADDAIGQ